MSVRINQKKRSAVFIDLKTFEYKRALDFQLKVVQSKIDKPLTEDKIFFVEHPCVFTLGKRGGKENLSVSQDFLMSKNIEVIQTERGGNITCHCSGQAVLYPIVDLERSKISVKDFVHGLEEIMLRTAKDFHIDADRDIRNHGLWVGNAKIGSVGISIKKGISFHGLAMNINPDLEPFSWIIPCGIKNISMTSVKKELTAQNIKKDISMNQIKDAYIKHFSKVFNYSIIKKNET
ncbi:MAG: lipoyl(octanoyl) transferase LipB [Desulfobacteraceae bacterium]|nr:lipoyl(octanoyl) transferase LipB [Desulfobacteraceae bacterium]